MLASLSAEQAAVAAVRIERRPMTASQPRLKRRFAGRDPIRFDKADGGNEPNDGFAAVFPLFDDSPASVIPVNRHRPFSVAAPLPLC